MVAAISDGKASCFSLASRCLDASGAAVPAALVACGLRLLLASIGMGLGFEAFYLAVMVVAITSGGGAALLTAAFCVAAAAGLAPMAGGSVSAIFLFGTSGLVISAVADSLGFSPRRMFEVVSRHGGSTSASDGDASSLGRPHPTAGRDRGEEIVVPSTSEDESRSPIECAASNPPRVADCSAKSPPPWHGLPPGPEQDPRAIELEHEPEGRPRSCRSDLGTTAEIRNLRGADPDVAPSADGGCDRPSCHASRVGEARRRVQKVRHSSERVCRPGSEANVIGGEADGKILEVDRTRESPDGRPDELALARNPSGPNPFAEPIEPSRAVTRLYARDVVREPESAGDRHSGSTHRDGLTSTPTEFGTQEARRTTIRDLTQRELTGAVPLQGEDRLMAVLNAEADAILMIDRWGTIEMVNPAAGRLFGYAPEEMIAENLSALLAIQPEGPITQPWETGPGVSPRSRREGLALRKDGSSFPVEWAVSEIGDRRRYTVVIRDTTPLKDLQREVLEIASREQRRIGQDLHDTVCQELTALRILAGDLCDALVTDPEAATALAERVSRNLQRCQEQLRAVIRGLIPVPADGDGLMVALADLAERVRLDRRLECCFECPRPVTVLDGLVATHLFLIAQEAVHNAVKHAAAGSVRITLEAHDGLMLRVEDDGTGLKVPGKEGRGLGLQIMRDRAEILAARLIVAPGDHGGTVVTCQLPRDPDE